ncbi:MAG: amidohydrolase [Patescibacteria group bacterium]|nr:amidohydrolase [Patescibacteria group bacterium]
MSLLIKQVILNERKCDLYIEEGRIRKIGQNLNLKANEKIDGRGKKAVMPGLINSHTHAAMTLFRGYADDLPLETWLKKKIWPIEKKMSYDDIYWGTKLACLEMIKGGTTCFNDMYWFEEATFEAVEEMGLRAVIGLVIVDFIPEAKKRVEKTFEKLKNRSSDRIKLSIAPHAIYTVSKENLIWAKKFASQNNLLLHLHLSETEKEVQECQRRYKMRPVEFLDKIGLLDENLIAVHTLWLDDREVEILAKKRVKIVHCPTSNMKLASGILPYRKLKRRKINITLGTDGPASNNSLDMFFEMKIASLLHKIKEMDPSITKAKEIFAMATKNGAKTLKIETGEIKEGKLADLVLIDLEKAPLIPRHHLISNLVYSASSDCVSDLICHGKILMRERRVEKENEIIKNSQKIAGRLIKKYENQ